MNGGITVFEKKCCLCGKKAVVGGRIRLKTNEYICANCWHNSGQSMMSLEKMTPAEVSKSIQTLTKEIDTINFQPTKTISDGMNHTYFCVDETRKEWYIPSRNALREVPEIHCFDEIIGYELLENSISLTKGGMAQAAIGAALFGKTGAIVGATTATRKTINECSSLCVKITLNDIQNSEKCIEFVTFPVKTDSAAYKIWYKAALEIISVLHTICYSNNQDEHPHKIECDNVKEDDLAVDKIRKYKSLYDEGIITKEEFDAKKKQLLGI